MTDAPSETERSRSVVSRQLTAYNNRDLDGFMACWHPDARLLQFPDTLIAAGIDDIRTRHSARFAQPYLWAELISRHVAGRIVSDHEIVTRTIDGKPVLVAVIAVYEVGEDGLIRTARFAEGPMPSMG